MYQLADKKEIMCLFHKGESVSQIRLKSHVSKSTLYRWKAEYDTIGKIMGYIRKGQLDRAKQEIISFQEKNKETNVLFTSKIIKYLINYGYLAFAKELAERQVIHNQESKLVNKSQLITIAKIEGDLETTERLCNEILELDPNNLPIRSQLITIAKQKGDLKTTERLCNEILELEPNNLPARFQLLTIARQGCEMSTVERLCNEILELDSNNLSTRIQLIAIAKQRGDLEAVERLCMEILELEPKDLIARSDLITIAIRKNDLETAERLCSEILELDPNNLPARSQLITIAKQKGDLETVEKLCNEILELEPNDLLARKQLITIARQKGDLKKSKGKLESTLPSLQTREATEKKKVTQKDPSKVAMVEVRRKIHLGTFLLDNIAERQKEMSELGINEVSQNLLLAEAYSRQNMSETTITYLKKALREATTPNLQKTIKALLEVAKTKNKRPSHINPWDEIVSSRDGR